MVIKVDECSTQMNMKLIMPTNVKMPTILGKSLLFSILVFMSSLISFWEL